MATSKHDSFESCYDTWMTQQRKDLEELVNALNTSSADDENKLKHLAEKNIKHFEEYHETRTELAKSDAPWLFSPSCGTLWENSFLWMGGWRPSMFIQLLYSFSRPEHLEPQLPHDDLFRGEIISPGQHNLINSLHLKTVREEDKLSTQMDTLQENIADVPFFMVAATNNKCGQLVDHLAGKGTTGESSWCKVDDEINVYEALDAHALPLVRMIAEADNLRLNILKELIEEVLTPLQAVHLLLASKKLHLSIHEWGKKRD